MSAEGCDSKSAASAREQSAANCIARIDQRERERERRDLEFGTHTGELPGKALAGRLIQKGLIISGAPDVSRRFQL